MPFFTPLYIYSILCCSSMLIYGSRSIMEYLLLVKNQAVIDLSLDSHNSLNSTCLSRGGA